MAQSKEEKISDLFVQVELKLNSIIQICDTAEKTYESSEWEKEKQLTMRKFDELVRHAEGTDEAAKDLLIRHLDSCAFRVSFALKCAELGVFVLFGGPGNLFPIPGFLLRFVKERAYEKL